MAKVREQGEKKEILNLSQNENRSEKKRPLPRRSVDHEISPQIQVASFDRTDWYISSVCVCVCVCVCLSVCLFLSVSVSAALFIYFLSLKILQQQLIVMTAYDNAVREQRLRQEMAQVRRETNYFLEQVGKSKAIAAMEVSAVNTCCCVCVCVY